MIIGGLLMIGWLPAVIYLLAVKPSRTCEAAAGWTRTAGSPHICRSRHGRRLSGQTVAVDGVESEWAEARARPGALARSLSSSAEPRSSSSAS